MTKRILSIFLLAISLAAFADPFVPGQVLTANGLNAALATKVSTSDLAASGPNQGAQSIGYKRAEVGAVARTVADKLSDVVSAREYGVDSTGIIDATAAINAALASCKNVILPAGNYKISGSLVDNCGTTLSGENPGAVTLTVTGSGFPVILLRASYASVSNITITSTAPLSSGAAIKIDVPISGNVISDVSINNAFIGIHVAAEAVITHIERVQIRNTYPGTGVGILIEGGNDTFIKQVVMDNSPGSQPLAGIRLRRTQAVWVTDTDVIHSGNPLLIDPDGSANGYITWCFFKSFAGDLSTGAGIKIAPTNGAIVKGLFFSNSWTSSNQQGIYITKDGTSTVDSVSFTDHTAYNNTQQGAYITAGSYVKFLGARIAGNSGAGIGSYPGIEFANGVSNFSVIGTRSGASAAFGVQQSYGAKIGTGSDGYTIADNDFSGNATGAYSDGSINTGGSVSVHDNLGASITRVAINGGSIDGTPVGASTPSTGGFTTISATSGAAGITSTNSGGGGYQYAMATTGATYQGKIGITTAGAMQFSNNNLTSVTFGPSGDVTGIASIKSTSPTAGVGYATGAGGAVSQATSKATGVTLNTVTGQITMNSAALATVATACFTLTDSAIAATDVVNASIASGATAGAYHLQVDAVAAGSARLCLYNNSGGSLSEAPVINFAVIRGSLN